MVAYLAALKSVAGVRESRKAPQSSCLDFRTISQNAREASREANQCASDLECWYFCLSWWAPAFSGVKRLVFHQHLAPGSRDFSGKLWFIACLDNFERVGVGVLG